MNQGRLEKHFWELKPYTQGVHKRKSEGTTHFDWVFMAGAVNSILTTRLDSHHPNAVAAMDGSADSRRRGAPQGRRG